MKKNKIYLNGRFLTQPITGVQRTAYELTKALDEQITEGRISSNFEIILIYSGEIINPIDLTSIRLLRKGIMHGNLWEQFELPFYTMGSLLVSMCTISCLIKRKQMVIVHDASFVVNPQYFSFAFRTWYRFAIPLLGRYSRQIITVSEFSRSELIVEVSIDPAKISVIRNAADHLKRFTKPGDGFQEKILALKPYCLAVSSLGANKNFGGLSKAIAETEFSGYNMLIAGGSIKALQHTAAEENVEYLGYVSNKELRFLYENASLFIFPSFYEGFGIPPLEAMAAGCPVLASRTSSMPEILGDAAEYCEPSEPQDIANKITELIHDPAKTERMKQLGYIQSARYSWKESAVRLYELIERYSA